MSAPMFNLPPELASFVAIEFPGPVGSSAASVERALDALGGLHRVSQAINTKDPNGALVELNYSNRPINNRNFTHPILGEPVETGNLVLKVIRRRKRLSQAGDSSEAGVYSVQVAGMIKSTIRFRAMADFQYRPDIENDPSVELVQALRTFDIDTLLNFRFEPPNEDFGGDLNLLPPPIFSRTSLPVLYNYKAPPSTVPTTFINVAGEEVTRLVNKDRYKSSMAASLSHYDETSPVPSGPLISKGASNAEEKRVLGLLVQLLETRPVWSRLALCNALSVDDARRLINSAKHLYALCSYTFSDGPYRELLIRFGYDPRRDVSARKYQRIMLRRTENTGKRNASDIASLKEDDEDRRVSHLFDGKRVMRNIGNYQLCDITDPILAPLLDDKQWFADYCNDRSGWFLPSFYEGFREILRLKFMAVTAGSTVPDSEMIEYIYKLPTGDALEQDRKVLRADAAKREARSQSVASGENGDPSGSEQGELTKIKRKSIKPKTGQKPKPKSKVSKPSIIDRLAPHLQTNGDEEG